MNVKRAPLVALVALVLMACGNRASDEAIRKILAPAPGTSLEPEVQARADAGVGARGAIENSLVQAGPSASVSAPVVSKPSSSSAARPSTYEASTGTGWSVPAAPQAAPSSTGAGPSPGEAVTSPSGVVPNPGEATQKSPVLLASVGTYSGPLGAVELPGVRAVQAWASSINDRGGLNGHAVRLLVYDDGGDSARHRVQVQEAIERQRVIAFVHNGEVFTGRPSVDYITAKRVPVIGSDAAADWFYESPMYFPQVSSGNQFWVLWINGVAQQMVPAGKTKLATLICVESAACEDADRIPAEEAPRLGFEHVYRGRASLSQPDFTAECLAARNAGAQVFMIGLDATSQLRIANACARQGYRPVFATGGIAAPSEKVVKEEPNLDGLLVTSNGFPYFQSGTPATDEFHQAMRTYAPKEPLGVGPATGWVSAKLLEKAAANLPEPPTSEAILQGLWMLHEETLDGLTGPLTFVANQPAARTTCWWPIVVKNRSWASPDGFQRHCR
jgi:branched-chain amino acid transport system substrate-binding protein